MRFHLTDLQQSWRDKGAALAADLAAHASAADAVMGAARVGLLDVRADLLAQVAATEAVAQGSPAAAVAYALHVTAMWAVRDQARLFEPLARGEVVGALALSSEDVPAAVHGRLTGDASWIAPATDHGVAIVGAQAGEELLAFAVALDAPGLTMVSEPAAGLRALGYARLELREVQATAVGPTIPVMARARALMAAVGLGIGRRALREALDAARASTAPDGREQTVQGLLADAATELDAATLVTWKAAAADASPSLGGGSMAKLAATEAAQRAVARATQVIGADTFRQGHAVERLAQDVRALELFAGRTEALRAAVAAEILP